MDYLSFLEDELLSAGVATHAGLFSLHHWHNLASSNGFFITQEQVAALSRVFTEPDGLDNVRRNGIEFFGEKMVVVWGTPRSFFAKKGGTGVICGRGKAVLIVATFDPPTLSNQLNVVMERALDHMNQRRV